MLRQADPEAMGAIGGGRPEREEHGMGTMGRHGAAWQSEKLDALQASSCHHSAASTGRQRRRGFRESSSAATRASTLLYRQAAAAAHTPPTGEVKTILSDLLGFYCFS